ncbi:MAG: hypothetical protein ACKOQV_02550 [Betaproteobacteria bacterium]
MSVEDMYFPGWQAQSEPPHFMITARTRCGPSAMDLPAKHVTWVPSNWAEPARQDLAAGGGDLVRCSVPEAPAVIDAGKARSLTVMATQRSPIFEDGPTLKKSLVIDYALGHGEVLPHRRDYRIQSQIVLRSHSNKPCLVISFNWTRFCMRRYRPFNRRCPLYRRKH